MQKEKNRGVHGRREGDAAKLLDLYIRNNNKQALLIHTPRQASLTRISQLIAQRFQVPPTDQILFYNGAEVQPSSQRNLVQVQDKGIIHLVDRRNITENIVISVRRLSLTLVQQFRVPASQIIEDFIVRNIQKEERNRLFFVYTGRELNPSCTFAEEFVENRSELFCLDEVKDEVVGEKRAMYERRMKREQSKKEGEYVKYKRKDNLKVDPIKQVSIEESMDGDPPQLREENPRKEEREEVKTPNFKKKNISEEVHIGQNDAPALQPAPSHQNSTSLADNFLENKSSMAPNTFFNEGSSISSICCEENHNPESSKRIDEPSIMFHSAYIGLSNQNQGLASRPGSIIINDSPVEEPSDAISVSFQGRAPELVSPLQQPLHTGEEIMQQSKEDYSDSKEELSAQEVAPQHSDNSSPTVQAKENSKDVSDYELDNVENHLLSESAQLQIQALANRSPPKNTQKQSDILIEDFQENKTLQHLGEQIEPIAHSHHHLALQHRTSSQSNRPQDDACITTPYFDDRALRLDMYVIQEGGQSGSEVLEDKEERKTNPHSLRSSNFHSSNSSRARNPYEFNNQYNFGQFERNNRNRFSNCQEYNPHDNQSQVETPTSEIHQEREEPPGEVEEKEPIRDRLEVGKQEVLRKKSVDDDHSLNIVQLPMEIRIKQNSSLLIDYDSKSDFPDNSRFLQNNNPFQEQNSGIDELKKLITNQKPISEHEEKSPQEGSPPISSTLDQQLHKSESDLGMVHHQHAGAEEAIETSLNFRMSRKLSKDNDLGNSPILIKQIKGVIDSTQSLEKIEVKNSLPYLNSYSRSVSSEMRFTNHKEVYSIGDFVFNCEVTAFHPLAFFLEALSKQEAQDIYRSYP